MIEVMKEFKLRCAHKLCDLKLGHKCMKLHGEYYTVRVFLRRYGTTCELPEHGMLVDFGDIKEVFNEKIFSRFDHATLIRKDDPLLEVLQKGDQKLVVLDRPPTAECLSEYIFRELENSFSDLARIEVVESEGCSASFEKDPARTIAWDLKV